MKFYNDGTVWFLGDSMYPAGVCHCNFNGLHTQVEISLINGRTILPMQDIGNFHDSTGTPYTNYATFTTATKGFFSTIAPIAVPTGNPIDAWIFDNIVQTQATLTDTWVYKLSTVTVGTIVITYVDSSKDVVSTISYTTA